MFPVIRMRNCKSLPYAKDMMMAELDYSPEQDDFYRWIEELDLDISPSELIESPNWLEPVTFEPEELERLEEWARDYAQELSERGLLPDLPPLDMDERLLEPELEQSMDCDLDFDR